MSQQEAGLTDADFAAAKEVLARSPALGELSQFDDPEQSLARIHHRMGSSKFQLYFGLRPPDRYAEQLFLDVQLGKLTSAAARQMLRARTYLSLEPRTLQIFFEEIEEDLQRFDHFLTAVGHIIGRPQLVTPEEEESLGHLATGILGKSRLYKAEVLSALDLIQEARYAKQLGRVTFQSEETATAAEMFHNLANRIGISWRRCCGLRDRSNQFADEHGLVYAVGLFDEATVETLPTTQSLRANLEEEHAIARAYLRELLGQEPTATSAAAPPTQEESAQTQFVVAKWSDLAIGIDAEWNYWAVTPPPPRGKPFPKSKAVQLILRGNHWKRLLGLLGEAEDGSTVNRGDLLQRLEFFLPPPTETRDKRARPGAIDESEREQLAFRLAFALKRLNHTLGDLRRKLAKHVVGPKKRHQICLQQSEEFVHSGFVVRFLVRDSNDRLTFGSAE